MRQSSFRRRAISHCTFALIAGVFMTFAIAWTAMVLPGGSHWYGPPADRDLGVASEAVGHRTFQISEGRNAWHHVVTYWWMQISGQSLTMRIADYEARKLDLDTLPAHLRPEALDEIVMMTWYHEVGWPLPALTCAVHWRDQILNANVIYRVEGGVQLPRDAEFNPRALPLTPLWPGFAVNVVVWAALWMIMIWGAGALQRRLWARSGRCVHCGYSRQGLRAGAACPECGKL